MSKLTDAVLALAEPVAAQQGCEIWDVEYVKEAGGRYLRVYIDKPDGVSIQDCENFSRALDPILDEADPIPDSYVFEVSSAGAERQLKRPGDFARFLGAQVFGALVVGAWAAGMGFIIFKGLDKIHGLRVSKRVEEEGLDIYEHGESAYGA
jgi:ribosome maturation factor RimP